MSFAVLTGGVACGKTAFADCLAGRSGGWVERFSCDDAVRFLWSQAPVVKAIHAAMKGYLSPAQLGGALDKEVVRELVFRVPEARKSLEEVLHPLVFQMLEEARVAAQKRSPAKVFLAEVPLYYESRASLPADTVIVVAASRMVQRARLIEHRKLDASTCDAVLNSQLPLEVKTEKADVVIWNDGSLAAMEAQASVLLKSRWPTLLNHV